MWFLHQQQTLTKPLSGELNFDMESISMKHQKLES